MAVSEARVVSSSSATRPAQRQAAGLHSQALLLRRKLWSPGICKTHGSCCSLPCVHYVRQVVHMTEAIADKDQQLRARASQLQDVEVYRNDYSRVKDR